MIAVFIYVRIYDMMRGRGKLSHAFLMGGGKGLARGRFVCHQTARRDGSTDRPPFLKIVGTIPVIGLYIIF